MDNLVLASATNGAITVTLPTAAAAGAGGQVTIKKIDNSANHVSVVDPAGAASLALFAADDTVLMVSNGTNWYRAQSSFQQGPDGFRAASVYGTPGTTNFVVPLGVTRLRVSVWGGGGGGGAGSSADPYAGSGGGAGGYAEAVYTVTPGATYAVVVGAGGAGAPGVNNADGVAGGESSFSGPGITNILRASGGGAGAQANAGGPGAGGQGQNGLINRRGGAGLAGNGSGSGGGGSAGNAVQQGVDAPAAGSAGGVEVALSALNRNSGGGGPAVGWNATGVTGGFPGGGGGGAWGYTVFPAAGRGGHGAVLIEY